MIQAAPTRLLLLATCASLLLAACDSNPAGEGRVSPLPYGYKEPTSRPRVARAAEGQQLDEIVAVVWGDVLTRRRLIRETGGRVAGQDDAQFEADLERRRVQWAREQLLVHAAEQEGLRLDPSVLDEAVEEFKREELEAASKNTGRPVTFEEYLQKRDLSAEEFRQQVRNREMRRGYLRKLLVGLGRSVRPQVDLTVSPAEVRRLYREEPALFDDQAGARFAFFLIPTLDELVGEATPAQAEAAARAKAEQVAQAFRAGTAPADIARRFGLSERVWREAPEVQSEFRYPEGAAWLFAPERRPRDARVFEFEKEPAGPIVLGVLEVRAAKKLDFDTAYDAVAEKYRLARQVRLENQKVIELVQGGSVVWPDSLADLLVDQARQQLATLDKDPVFSRARFR